MEIGVRGSKICGHWFGELVFGRRFAHSTSIDGFAEDILGVCAENSGSGFAVF